MAGKVSITLTDGAFGVAGTTAGICCYAGITSLGVPGTVVGYSDIKQLAAGQGVGATVDAAALGISENGFVLVSPVTASVSGSVGTVSCVGTGPSSNVTFTGTPLDAFEVRIKIVKGGSRGTATFRYALDGSNPAGPTWSKEIATAATVALAGTGLTAAFATATYVAGDLYSADCVAPGYSNNDLVAAVQALLDSRKPAEFIHCVGQGADAAATAGTIAALETILDTAFTKGRDLWASVELPDVSDSSIGTALASVIAPRVEVVGGFAEIASPITTRVQKRSAGSLAAMWAAQLSISQSLGETAAGPLPAACVAILRDEGITPGLDDIRVTTLRTYDGQAGFYFTNGWMLTDFGSDYSLVQYRRVINETCRVVRRAFFPYINRRLVVNPDGTIEELQAQAIEADVRSPLVEALLAPSPPHASAVSLKVDRTNNLLTTKKLLATTRVLPDAYPEGIDVDVGFMNPRTVVASG